MAFLSDIFGRMGRVARGQANAGVDAMEDATFEATVRQTVADMKTELNNVVRASAMAMSNYNSLQAEYDKYIRQSQEWKDRAEKNHIHFCYQLQVTRNAWFPRLPPRGNARLLKY